MTASALLARLGTLGVAAEVDGSALRLRPASRVPAGMLAELRAKKADLLALLTEPANDPAPALRPPPADAAALLLYLRDVLHCRVCFDGEAVWISPTYRCPPRVLATAMAVLPTLRLILEAE